MTRDHEARFTCLVRNSAGESRKNYNVYVNGEVMRECNEVPRA